MLSCSLIEILDIRSHGRCGYGFPCLFYDQHLTPLLDTHLLGEHIHDYQDDNGGEPLVLHQLIKLKHDKTFIEQG